MAGGLSSVIATAHIRDRSEDCGCGWTHGTYPVILIIERHILLNITILRY